MRQSAQIVRQVDFAEALTREEPDMPLPGLVDLRLEAPLLDQTEVLDAQQLLDLRAEYEAMRGQAPEVRAPERVELAPAKIKPAARSTPMRRLIGVLIAVLLALVGWSVSRTWLGGREVVHAATKPPVAEPTRAVPTPPARRTPPSEPAAANLPRIAVEALASGDLERARRSYEELARHELEPGPFSVAAQVLAQEIKGEE